MKVVCIDTDFNGTSYGTSYGRFVPGLNSSEDEIIKLNHYTNIQPLCSKINRDIKKDLIYKK